MGEAFFIERARAQKVYDQIAFVWNLDDLRESTGIHCAVIEINPICFGVFAWVDPDRYPKVVNFAAFLTEAMDFAHYIRRFGYL